MQFFKRIDKAFHTRMGSYIFFTLAIAAFIFLYSAKWAYGWIAELYPLSDKFIPVLFCALGLCVAITLGFLLAPGKTRAGRVPRAVHTAFCVLTGGVFAYTAVLQFGLDKGFDPAALRNGAETLMPSLPFLGIVIGLPLVFVCCKTPKKKAQGLLIALIISAMVLAPGLFPRIDPAPKWGGESLPPILLRSQNVLQGATVMFESLRQGETPSAENLLEDGGACWNARDPARRPAESHRDINNSFVEIRLAQASTFNTAVIEEAGNQAQYFRLQALVEGEWHTFYQSEKIQDMRLCSFDAVTTDRVRFSIDKFRSSDTPARIRSLRLYNEPRREAGGFEVTAYQRLDGDVPTEVLAKGESFVKAYARFYDVYSTVIVFAAVRWDENGNMDFGNLGEEGFAREMKALKEIISYRSNQEHQVKVIVTTLADGTWQDIGVNGYMAKHWETIADQTAAFVEKYDLSGVDIDWEHPSSQEDWRLFDKFIAQLDDGIKAIRPDAILSGALASWALGMSEDTLARFDQIQFMAYDGRDMDGYQSSLQQAQEGLQRFIEKGVDAGKINIGIAAYGRPVNGSPFWKAWRDLDAANYWDSKYYNVLDSDYQTPNAGQIYDGTFCAPALAGDKAAYALFSGAGGVMVFRVACDKTMDDHNSMAHGIENALKRYAAGW